MKLILSDDDGTVLDSTDVSDADWDLAQVSPRQARAILNELQAGERP